MGTDGSGSGLTRRQALRGGVGAGVAAAATLAAANAASAQTPGATPAAGALTGTKPTLTDAGALAVMQAALAKAREIGVPEIAAVVDDAGLLKAFARMDGTPTASIDLAMDKAYTAASFKTPTDQFAQALGKNPVAAALMKAPRVILLGGGEPLLAGKTVIGAIGCSGGTAEQDVTCAKAGASALPKM